MMNKHEREVALTLMKTTSDVFYASAVRIGNHPFIEFAGLMNEYIKVCEAAHEQGIDFSNCSAHTGQQLPLREHHIAYLVEKLQCIYGDDVVGRQVGSDPTEPITKRVGVNRGELADSMVGDIMDALEPLRQKYGARKLLVGVIYVSGFAGAAYGMAVNINKPVREALQPFASGYELGFARWGNNAEE